MGHTHAQALDASMVTRAKRDERQRRHRQLNASDASRWPNAPTTLGARHLRPDTERTLPKHPVVGGSQQMPPDLEQVLDDAVHRQEPLRLRRGFEPAHLPLPLPRRLMRYLGPVVCILPRVVPHRRHHSPQDVVPALQ